ncbi:MAG: DNA-processing protein DprA [Candidatus Falkowbacteria bacterium]
MNNLKYLVALTNFPKFGPVRITKIKKIFPDLGNAFNASYNELIKTGIEGKIIEEFISERVKIDPDKIMEELDKENIKILTIEDKNYPKLLSEIYCPPPLLYYKGSVDYLNEFCLAVVGSRKYTAYGRQITEQIVKNLAQNNLTIISGLALGVDSIAHNSALEVNGKTVAVLGTGIDRKSIYPYSNTYLADKIIDSGGAIISEFPIKTPPLRFNFPQRNRIIAGLSLGTLVVEATEKSGALITSNYALEQNREVFAVPGNIYSPVSIGPNNLIKSGAKPVTNAEDIIEALDLNQITDYIENKKIIPDSPEEEKILAHINHEPIHINDIARILNLNITIINSALAIMEMKGMIKNLGNMQYVLAR